jgi:hypothetical protein
MQVLNGLIKATTMFFGEFLALFIFLALRKKDPEGFKMRALEAQSRGL